MAGSDLKKLQIHIKRVVSYSNNIIVNFHGLIFTVAINSF
jgi:hypothetical protein